MRNFRTLNGLQNYIKKNGIPDFFKFNGNLYQNDYYDMSGGELIFTSIDDSKAIYMYNRDRYKSLSDTELVYNDIFSLRLDTTYYYTKEKSLEEITKRFKTITFIKYSEV